VADSFDSTPEERSRSASHAAKERWRKKREATQRVAAVFGESPAVEPKKFTSYDSIDDYDSIAGPPADWPSAKKREEVIGELTLNQTRRVALQSAQLALEREQGKVLAIADVEAREEKADEIYQLHLQRVVDLVCSLVPPEKMSEARAKATDWIAETRRAIAADLSASV